MRCHRGRGNAGTILITGGVVTALGGLGAAGIGGGAWAGNTTGNVTIEGALGAGIGGGWTGSGGTIKINTKTSHGSAKAGGYGYYEGTHYGGIGCYETTDFPADFWLDGVRQGTGVPDWPKTTPYIW